MKAVFLGGSRRISRLNDVIRSKLDDLVERELWMFVGDANGADRALQQHLATRGYDRVVVYAVTGFLRNNVGSWKTRSVDAPPGARGFALYSVKDARMAEDASYGLMLWDGKSRGTLANVRRLLVQWKPVAVYLGPERRFLSLKSPEDLHQLGVDPGPDLAAQRDLPFGDAAGAVHESAAAGGRELWHRERPRSKTSAKAGRGR
jgi:hypothetical protein